MYFRFHSFLPPHRDTRWRGQVSWCHQFGVVVSPWCHPSLVTPRCHLTDKLAEIQSSLLSPFTCFSDCPICNPFELFVSSPISFHFTEEFLSARQTHILMRDSLTLIFSFCFIVILLTFHLYAPHDFSAFCVHMFFPFSPPREFLSSWVEAPPVLLSVRVPSRTEFLSNF